MWDKVERLVGSISPKSVAPVLQPVLEVEQSDQEILQPVNVLPEVSPTNKSAEVIPFKPIKPILAIDNTLRTIDTSETFMETVLQNAAYVIADKLRTDDTIKDLVESVRKDFVNMIREIEWRTSLSEKKKLTLIGPKWLNITLCISNEAIGEYKYIIGNLKKDCNVVYGVNGVSIDKADPGCFWYSFVEDGIQMIFELDPGKSSFDTHGESAKKYFNLLEGGFPLLWWAFLQWIREINNEISALYTDSDTGLLNHLAYKKTKEALEKELKISWKHFTEHAIEILPNNLVMHLLGDYGREALMRMIADTVKPLDPDMTFAYKHVDRNMAVIFIDRTNSPEIIKKLSEITAAMSRRIEVKNAQDLIVNVELITKKH